jgi:predicted dehydrogenase
MIRVAIIGAGRIGRIRVHHILAAGDAAVGAVCDTDLSLATQLAESCAATVFNDWTQVLSRPDIDAVIVATPTIAHAPIAVAAATAGKHVLCEKPLARSVAEAAGIVSAAQAAGIILKVGFNYRHLPHIRKAKELIDSGELGKLMFLRCHFGHGGRPGFEREWHADPTRSGGGVLLEQGIHLMDLTRYLLGEPVRCLGKRSTLFWPLAEIEDNCFCLFETSQGQIAEIHVSWTQWVNTFSMEIHGQDGYLRLLGRDGHYGPPRIDWGRRNANHSRPIEQHIEYGTGEDWKQEWQEFVAAIEERRQPLGSGRDGLCAQVLVEATYASAAKGAWIDIPSL